MLPLPQFPSESGREVEDFHMHGPCNKEGISMHIPPGHTDNPGASLPSPPSAGGPVWIPAGAGDPPVAEYSRADGSSTRVPPLTSATAPISCSPLRRVCPSCPSPNTGIARRDPTQTSPEPGFPGVSPSRSAHLEACGGRGHGHSYRQGEK